MSNPEDFVLLDGEHKQAQTPYGEAYLRSLRTNAQVLQGRGQQVSHTFYLNAGPGEDETTGRPVASVSGWATLMVIPWWVHPQLEEIRFSHHLRVAHGPDDLSGVEFQPQGIDVRYEFLSDPARAQVHRVEPRTVGDEMLHQTVTHIFDAGDSATTQPRWDILAIAVRSVPEPGLRDPDNWFEDAPGSFTVPDSVLNPDQYIRGIWYPRSSDQVRLSDGATHFYEEEAGPGKPDDEANEVTCSALLWTDDHDTGSGEWDPEHIRLVDHLGMHSLVAGDWDTGRQQHIWPPTPDLLRTPKEEEDGETIDPDEERFYKWVAKCWIPYGQWRSVTINEVRTEPEHPRIIDIEGGARTKAHAYRRLRQHLADGVHDPKIFTVGTPGWTFEDAGDWNTWRYLHRHPFLQGGAGVSDGPYILETPRVAPYARTNRRLRLLVAGAYFAFADEEEWEDLQGVGVEATVEFCGVEQRLEFGATTVSQDSHWATVKRKQLRGLYSSIPDTHRLTYREGMLHIGTSGTDYAVPEVVDVPFPWEDDQATVEFAADPDFSWVDEVPVGGLDDDGNPRPESAFLFVLGYCVYQRSGGG